MGMSILNEPVFIWVGKLVNKIKKIFLISAFICTSFLVFAQSESDFVLSDDASTEVVTQTTSSSSSSGIGVFIRMIVALIIVVALIYGIFWFIKHKTNAVKSDDKFLRNVSHIDLAPGKSIAVVTLIDKAYLLGVSDSGVNLISEIDDEELIQAMNLQADKEQNTKKPINFAEVLEMFTAKGKKKEKNAFSESESMMDNLFKKK